MYIALLSKVDVHHTKVYDKIERKLHFQPTHMMKMCIIMKEGSS